MKHVLLTGTALTLALASCAPRYNPQSATPDAALSCAQIQEQLVRAQAIRADALDNKGVSAQNVAWALLFWPGIVLNEVNNNQVIDRIDERVRVLNGLYTSKSCAAK